MTNWAVETRQVHSGAVPDPTTGARAVPIHPATSYVFRDTTHAAAAFELTDLTTHAYTRLPNPTTAVAEERIASACDFAELVIPELRRRGPFRTHYTGRTLRDHLGLPRPFRQA